jgi:hypothetical protein
MAVLCEVCGADQASTIGAIADTCWTPDSEGTQAERVKFYAVHESRILSPNPVIRCRALPLSKQYTPQNRPGKVRRQKDEDTEVNMAWRGPIASTRLDAYVPRLPITQ